MVKYLLSALSVISFSRCAMTELPLAHNNPLDRIYDSGKFRMVLTAEAKSPTLTQLNWSNVYHSEDGELSDAALQLNSSANILRSAAAPSAGDLTAVKNGSPLSGAFTAIGECAVKVTGTSYAGSCDATSFAKGYFILQFNYRYTGKSGVATTGIFYSNFVAVQ